MTTKKSKTKSKSLKEVFCIDNTSYVPKTPSYLLANITTTVNLPINWPVVIPKNWNELSSDDKLIFLKNVFRELDYSELLKNISNNCSFDDIRNIFKCACWEIASGKEEDLVYSSKCDWIGSSLLWDPNIDDYNSNISLYKNL